MAEASAASNRLRHVVWSAAVDPSVVTCDAEPITSGHPDAFGLHQLTFATTTIISRSGAEHLSISDGLKRIRLDVVSGTLLEGPVRFHYRLSGFDGAETHLITVQRLLSLNRLGRFARGLHPPETKAERWVMMLRAHDLSAAGASQREIAVKLFGTAASAEWRTQSDFLRLRIQRLLRDASTMIDGGYLDLLRGPNAIRPDASR